MDWVALLLPSSFSSWPPRLKVLSTITFIISNGCGDFCLGLESFLQRAATGAGHAGSGRERPSQGGKQLPFSGKASLASVRRRSIHSESVARVAVKRRSHSSGLSLWVSVMGESCAAWRVQSGVGIADATDQARVSESAFQSSVFEREKPARYVRSPRPRDRRSASPPHRAEHSRRRGASSPLR